MLDNNLIVHEIQSWPMILGIEIPKELQQVLYLLEAVQAVDVRPIPFYNHDKLTTKNAASVIHDLARQAALAANHTAGGETVLGIARQQVLRRVTVDLVHHAKAAVPGIVDAITPTFTEAADAYRAAVALLPDEPTEGGLLNAGPEVVTAYRQAADAAGYLRSIGAWLAGLNNIGVGTGANELVIRCVRPSTLAELARLDSVHAAYAHAQPDQRNAVITALDPVLFAAARIDVPFGIVLPGEAAHLRRELSGRVLVN